MAHTTTCSTLSLFRIFSTIAFVFLNPGCFAQEANPEVPPQKWFITTPTFEQARLDLFLTYNVSDYVPYENLGWFLYDGPECREGANDITENNYLSVELMGPEDGNTVGEGNVFREFTMALSFDPDNIRDSPILHETGLKTQLIFCVRLGAFTANVLNPAAIEIFSKQTTMTVDILQEGDFGTDEFVLDADDIIDQTAEQLYTLEGWLCNKTNHRIYDPIPIYQGTPTRVCVTPNAEARADGVYMRSIDYFYWTRDTIFQTAITPHQVAAPLTEIECVPGMLICAFTTILKASFFFKRGQVGGAGMGWLQFGRGDYIGDATRRVEIVMFQDEGPLAISDNGIGGVSTRQDDTVENAVETPGGVGSPGYAGDGPFQVEIPVTRLYNAIGYLCDLDNIELNPLENPLTKGDKARVCVTPDAIALLDDVKIRAIDSYDWLRKDFNVSQTAITSHASSAPKTEIFCRRGSLVCAFETILDDEFYGTPGKVEGTGIVWLQFGSQSRRVQFDLGFSLLPDMEPGFAGATPFDAHVYVLPPAEFRQLYTCRAFECAFDNREIVTNDAKTQGSSVRMCVVPSAPAVEAGAKMWSVEWWTWSQVNVNQTAVELQGREAEDGRTLLMCHRGMDLCFFQTRLIDDFFQLQTNGINGDGHCWITFGGLMLQGAIEPSVPSEEEELIDPSRDPLYAGRSDIAIFFPVTGNYTEDLSCPPEVHSLKLFWEEEDPTLKMLYISCMVGAGTGLCCLFGLCFFCNRRRDEEEYITDEQGKIVVNVDVEDVQNTENHVHQQYDEKKQYSLDTTHREESSEDGFSGKRSAEDVCFGDSDHPGTKSCSKALRTYIKQNPDASFGPDVYNAIKNRMGGRHLLTRDSPRSKWRETTKSEAISAIGKMWREQKYK